MVYLQTQYQKMRGGCRRPAPTGQTVSINRFAQLCALVLSIRIPADGVINLSTMKKIDINVIAKVIIALVLGGLTPFVFILGAEPFEVPGTTSIAEITAGSIVGAFYLAFCQFWVASRGGQGRTAKWPTAIAMIAPVIAAFGLIACVETRETLVTQGLPMLAAATCGIVFGAVMAARRAVKNKTAA